MAADTYPLGPEWLANKSICPTMPGFESFEAGADWAAATLAKEGTVSFEYGCLSGFQVSIYSLDRLPQLPRGISKGSGGRTFYMVAVGCGSFGGVHPQPISEAEPYDVGAKLNLLEDDAKAIAYLLRQIGKRLPRDEEETTVRPYVLRDATAEAMHYLGGFPLDFLKPAERVRSGPDNDGAAEVITATQPSQRLALVPLGGYLVRWPSGVLQVYDADAFSKQFEDRS